MHNFQVLEKTKSWYIQQDTPVPSHNTLFMRPAQQLRMTPGALYNRYATDSIVDLPLAINDIVRLIIFHFLCNFL